MEARSLLAAGRVAGDSGARLSDLRRIAQLESEVAELRAERTRLLEDLSIARSWIRDLMRCIEGADGEAGLAVTAPDRPARLGCPPLAWRRLAAITALVTAPWAVMGAAVAAGLGLF